MTQKQETLRTLPEHHAWKVVALCWLAYFIVYLGRLNYSACLVGITESLDVTKAQAGLVSSFFFIAYGAGQFINGLMAGKFNPWKMITVSMVIAAVINLIMPFIPSVGIMKYLWLVNGFAQSTLWTSIIRIYSDFLPSSIMSRSIVIIHTTGAAGTLAAYGIAALSLQFASWKLAFYIGGAAILVFAPVWFFMMRRLEGLRTVPDREAVSEQNVLLDPKGITTLFVSAGVLFAFVAAFANGALRDGITLWIPTMIRDKYGTSPAFSTFVSILLPVFNMFGAVIGKFINDRVRNIYFTSAVSFGCALLSLGLLVLFPNSGIFSTCLLFAIVTTAMTGVNTMIVSVLPISLRQFGCSANAAGIINAFCYVGSTVTTYGLGSLADSLGWNAVVVALVVVTVCALVCCIFGGHVWRRFTADNAQET